VQGIEGGQQIAATHRARRAHLQQIHTQDSRHGLRQFSSWNALICKGFWDWQVVVKLSTGTPGRSRRSAG
jgi:hypothetical protein